MSRTHVRPMERPPGTFDPVLSASLLARIHELNLDYLDLLASEHTARACAAQLHLLPAALWPAIAGLSREERCALAAAPFTLYSLGFEDDGFWRIACNIDGANVSDRYAATNGGWLQGPFCEAALMCAWHVAISNPLAGRLLYAMGQATAARLAAAPLWRIKRIAGDYAALLSPRWPTNPAFWPDLVRYAAAHDAQRLRAAQLLGHQLIAAELECAADRAHRGASRCAEPPSPRLRARKVRHEVRGGVSPIGVKK